MAEIVSKPASQEYRDNFDRIFGRGAYRETLDAYAAEADRKDLIAPNNALVKAVRKTRRRSR